MTGEAPLKAVGLEKTYQTGRSNLVIFRNLCLEAAAGEKLALVGESGAGKSTLLYLLGGLDRPTAGKILYEGSDITRLNEQRLAEFRNRTLGFVWQTHYLLPEFTALENVAMPLRIRGVSAEEAEERAMERLREVGLEARSHHLSGELSGGEQQRVVLARALVGNPKVLLADEPTGNLDGQTGERIIGLLAEMHAQHGLTSIYVTHNLAFARTCDRVLELKGGELVLRENE
ncbi:MAG: ABC transporter ATP-binding protein [Bryobacterales bacterium]|nr:ABC transporter ATP-binding protein [Bryobacterales bacterium]